MNNLKLGGLSRLVFTASLILLAFTGFGQMPLYKRYYVADLPGMAFSADFFVTHWLHYLGAAVFGFFVFRAFFLWLSAGMPALTPSGRGKVLAIILLLATGYLRVYRNLPGEYVSPLINLIIDWGHIFAAMLYGAFALWGGLGRQRGYLKPQSGLVS